MKPDEAVTETKDSKESRLRHPAMGLISVSRYSSTGQQLFGSDITHHHYIHVQVQRAEVTRHLSRE